TSLADRAWGRESAVFRITGVISVIGGWFLTAGVAFIGAGIIVTAMHFGGLWVMMIMALLTIFLIIRSNRRFRKRAEEDNGDALFQTIINTRDKSEIWPMLMMYISEQQQRFFGFAGELYSAITAAFINDNAKVLAKAEQSLSRQKTVLKNSRRKETLCLRSLPRETAIEKSAWFYLSNNCCMGILYNLRRINEVCKEHVENNFTPLPQTYAKEYELVRTRIEILFNDTINMMSSGDTDVIAGMRRHCDEIKDSISEIYHRVHDQIRDGDTAEVSVLYVYVNLLQETQEMVSMIRKYLRAFAKLQNSDYRSRAALSAR
ncbi:MAG: inorganic phosphate transporter, partial [Muribaculaceae bacterium]|nr:inorganic phosphate transporter [Muribaculaceae bacterium]